MRVLLAEDEVQMSQVLVTAMTHQNYEITAVYDGEQAVSAASKDPYDVIILDIMMPKKDGLEALKEIRAAGNRTHIIMLTAMAEIDDRVTGLDLGADDYLTKPFSLKELLARLRSMERRADSTFTPNVLAYGSVKLNVSEQEIVAKNSIRLSGKETKLMEYLLLNTDKELTTDNIFQHIWEDDDDKNIVWVYVSYLRQKLQAINADIQITGEKDGIFKLTMI